MQSKGNYSEAEQLYESLAHDYPEKAEPRFYCGACARIIGNHVKALGYFLQASEMEPNNAEYLAWIGKSLSSAGHYNMAITQCKKALELDENNLTALSLLGYIYTHKSFDSEGAKILNKAVAIKPSNANNQANLALVLARLGNYEQAVIHANKAIRLSPKNPDTYSALGNVHLIHGNHSEAIQCFLKAIEINPLRGNTWYAIATAKKIMPEDGVLIKKMEHTLKQSMPSEARKNLLFALGKAYDDLKDSEKAFTYAEKANMLVHSDYDPNSNTRNIKQIKSIFSKNYFIKNLLPMNGNRTPIFVVGMPRSGSTLIDQILSTHSKVHSVGESTAIPDIIDEISEKTTTKHKFPNCLQVLDKTEIDYYRNVYLEQTGNEAGDCTHVIDKNLFNYQILGLIAVLFPNARIIHSMRHPLDTCLSCYMTGFTFTPWTHNLEYIGKYYRDYVDIMAHWRKVLPTPILDIHYEDLVMDTEKNAQSIIEFCGLEWEDKCLDFYKTKRGINTASIWQVRQPIYKSAVQRWVPYAKHLQPLILALGDLLEDDYAQIESLGLKHGPRSNSLGQKLSKFFK